VVTTESATFVAPDNGLLTPVFARHAWRAFELSAPELRLPRVSRTFHGRDVFAPAAAHVVRGVAPERFGEPVLDPVRVAWADVHAVGGAVAGAVVHVDRFGNLITSIAGDAVEGLGAEASIHIAGRRLPLVGTYADLPLGAVGALVGSSNRLEIAVREGSAAAVLRARRGTPVAVSRTSAPASKKTTKTSSRRRS
jgi:S-adenosylmethionine hydrolase